MSSATDMGFKQRSWGAEMAATIRITCTHSAPKGWEWVNHINKGFRHPTAFIDGDEKQLAWDGATDIPVAAGQPHKLQVFFKLFGLHWCPAEVEILPLKDGETQNYEYHLEVKDRWVNRGRLNRV